MTNPIIVPHGSIILMHLVILSVTKDLCPVFKDASLRSSMTNTMIVLRDFVILNVVKDLY